jgi:hypothetical protein
LLLLFPSVAVAVDTEQEADNKPSVVAVVEHRCIHTGIEVGKGVPKAAVGYRHLRFVEDNVHRNPSYSMCHIAYKVGEEWPQEFVE